MLKDGTRSPENDRHHADRAAAHDKTRRNKRKRAGNDERQRYEGEFEEQDQSQRHPIADPISGMAKQHRPQDRAKSEQHPKLRPHQLTLVQAV